MKPKKRPRCGTTPAKTSGAKSAQRVRLDDLPVEILHRILAFGPVTAALALTRVNKTLRAISAAPGVYRRIVDAGNGIHKQGRKGDESPIDNDSYDDNDDKSWWVDQGFDHEQDWKVCAKWAFADMVVREAHLQNQSSCDSWRKALYFLPELLSQRHKVAGAFLSTSDVFNSFAYRQDFWCHQFEDIYTKWPPPAYDDRIARAAFVYAYHCTLLSMSQKEGRTIDPLDQTPLRTINPYLPKSLDRIFHTFLPIVRSTEDLWTSHSFIKSPNPEASAPEDDGYSKLYWLRCITFGTMMVGILHRRLEISIEASDLFRAATYPNLLPPKATEIPFEQYLSKNSTPFTTTTDSSAASCFIARHIPHMTSSEFLTAGEWIGYWNNTWSGSLQWDTIIHGVFFNITAENASHKTVHARGVDGIGSFTLTGTFDTRKGWVRWVSAYENGGLDYEWSAVMTAFGIIGNWGSTSSGWFWLWPRSWSKEIIVDEEGDGQQVQQV